MNTFTRTQELFLCFITNTEIPLESKEYVDLILSLFMPPVIPEVDVKKRIVKYRYLLDESGKYNISYNKEAYIVNLFRKMIMP
jgi:hypothetical protein